MEIEKIIEECHTCSPFNLHAKMLVIAIGGLEEIAKNLFCLGPGCTYCETGEHPPSHEAIRATATLKAIKEVA